MKKHKKIIRAVTVSESIEFFEPMVPELQKRGYDVVSVSSSGPEQEGLKEKGVKVISVEMARHISLIKDLVALIQLIFVFRREKPYMVHSMTPKAGLLCMLAAWICRVPRRVHTFTGLVWPTATGLTRKIVMFTDRLTCFCATHIIPEGEGVKNDLSAHITKKPMQVLGYGNCRGIDMERWELNDKVKADRAKLMKKGVFTFLFVGRLVGDKGINELVEAFIKLLAKKNNIRLVLVGPYEKDLDPLKQITIDRIDNTPEIEAVGSKYGDELIAYYAASDCYVFPSYREGFPNTVLEAGAMGLPQIVTDINGSREIITWNEPRTKNNDSELSIRDNGIVIPSKNVDALYKAMERMISDEEMRKKMSYNARPMIYRRYEQSFVRGCLYRFYDEIMK